MVDGVRLELKFSAVGTGHGVSENRTAVSGSFHRLVEPLPADLQVIGVLQGQKAAAKSGLVARSCRTASG
jgi:hypothetical protein